MCERKRVLINVVMNVPNKLINKYNRSHNYLVITEYPSIDEKKGGTALSRFSKNTVSELQRIATKQKRKGIILTNIIDKKDYYELNNTLIIRCWKRNNIFSFFNLLYYVYRLNKVRSVLFEFEFATYGSEKISIIIPLIMAIFRLMGKKTTFVLHQAVSNIASLHRHLGLKRSSFMLFILQNAIGIFYITIGLFTERVIVLEGAFKERLSGYINPHKITVIPHGIEVAPIQKAHLSNAKPVLQSKDKFVLMVFGYIAWYKGIDNLIRQFKALPHKIQGKKLRLIIAGGPSIAQKDKDHYIRFYNKIYTLARADKRITITGFIPEQEVASYFRSADLCVIPYKRFISSSGPLSLALTYKRPVVFAQILKRYLKSDDFYEAFVQSELKEQDIFIPIRTAQLRRVILTVMNNDRYNKKMKKFTSILLKKRQWNNSMNKYFDLLFPVVNKNFHMRWNFYRIYDILKFFI